jgi:nitroreductase
MDAGFALQNLALAAHALGLGSCLMYHCETVNQKSLRTDLNIPYYYRIYCAVLLGYPDETPLTPARVSVEEIATFMEDSRKYVG